MEMDALGIWRTLKMLTNEILKFIVDFNGMHVAAQHPLSQTERRIAGEGSKFENVAGIYHPHKHFQQASLQMS